MTGSFYGGVLGHSEERQRVYVEANRFKAGKPNRCDGKETQMKRWKKVLFLVVAVLCVALLTVMQLAAAEKVVKFGVVGPYTGPASRSGAEFRAAAEMAFEKISYKIGDYKIEL